jgi:hypothetical protein
LSAGKWRCLNWFGNSAAPLFHLDEIDNFGHCLEYGIGVHKNRLLAA